MNKKNIEVNIELVVNKTEEGWEASIPAVGIKELGESAEEAIDKATDTFIRQEVEQTDWNPTEIRFNIQ